MDRFYLQKKRIFSTGAFIPNALLLGTREYIKTLLFFQNPKGCLDVYDICI